MMEKMRRVRKKQKEKKSFPFSRVKVWECPFTLNIRPEAESDHEGEKKTSESDKYDDRLG